MESIPTWSAVVAAAIYHRDGRILLQQRPSGKHHGGLWEFPGGKVEIGETPRDALVREIDEELGLRLESQQLHPVGFAEEASGRGASPIVLMLYEARAWGGEVHPVEGQTWGWFSPQAANDLPLAPMDRRLLHGSRPEIAR